MERIELQSTDALAHSNQSRDAVHVHVAELHQVTPHPSSAAEQDPNQPTFEAYPEGGFRAYTVLLGAWCALLPASGILTTTGALQAYLLDQQLKQKSEAEVGWIFSVFAFLFFFGRILGGLYLSNDKIAPC